MKRLILALVVILISANSLYAAKFNWTEKMLNPTRTVEFYIDKKSVKRINNFVYYWSLANIIKPLKDAPELGSSFSYNKIDCADMGYQTIIFIAYTGKMGNGEILFHDSENPDKEEDKRFDPKNSVAYITHDKLCNY
tara:strand:- start:696 stop:1106 length:411 start_codon:yes stop_codon:yes gene_type:complete